MGRNEGVTRLRPPPERQVDEDCMEAAYGRLSAAIVRLACLDYSEALEGMLKAESRAVRKHCIDQKRSLEKFFLGGWYTALCGIDPESIMEELEKRAVQSVLDESRKGLEEALARHDRRDGH